MAIKNADGTYSMDQNEYDTLQANTTVNKNNTTAQSLADTYGVPVSYSSEQDLNATGEGLGLAKALYGETVGNVGTDAADYTARVKANLDKDYAGADSLRQQTASQVSKASAAAGLNGVNNVAMQNQLYRQGAMQANTLNQEYKDKALAAYGRNVSARQSGQSGIVMGYKGLGVASTPTQTVNYDSGSVICTELYRQGKITKNEWMRASVFGYSIHQNTYFGYLVIAKPIVKLMKKSDKLSNLFVGWAKSIAKQEPNLITRILMPLCWSIGYVRKTTQKEITRIA